MDGHDVIVVEHGETRPTHVRVVVAPQGGGADVLEDIRAGATAGGGDLGFRCVALQLRLVSPGAVVGGGQVGAVEVVDRHQLLRGGGEEGLRQHGVTLFDPEAN